MIELDSNLYIYMMPYTTIERLISLGASVSIDTNSNYPYVTLERFTALAVHSGGHIVIRGAGRLPYVTLERLAAVGRNSIRFDFDV